MEQAGYGMICSREYAEIIAPTRLGSGRVAGGSVATAPSCCRREARVAFDCTTLVELIVLSSNVYVEVQAFHLQTEKVMLACYLHHLPFQSFLAQKIIIHFPLLFTGIIG